MRKIIFSLFAAIAVLGACQGTTDSTVVGEKAEFQVRGNCYMCRERIENSAGSVEGVKTAKWDVSTGLLTVVFDSLKTSELSIHNAIAATGHGTGQVAMDQKAHDALPDCCKVKEKKHADHSHEGHNH